MKGPPLWYQLKIEIEVYKNIEAVMSQEIFILKYIWLFEKKSFILKCNLKQSSKGVTGGKCDK